ncbi:MAG: protoporphyrinogen oxidase [Myxococcota bacterium]
MPPEITVDALVAGAGISGLAAAHELQAAGCEVLVIDPSDRPGGVMRTEHRGGYIFESGPNTAQVKAPMRAFLERRHLEDALRPASPASRKRWLFRDGALQPVPSSVLGFLRTPLLSTRAKLSVLAEPLRSRGKGEPESVREFTARRLGPEVADRLVGPFLTGVYAGDENELGAEAVFPSLVEAERRSGSVLLGSLGQRGPKGLPGSRSSEDGFGPFARRLAEALHEPPAMGSRVAGLYRDGDRWHVDVASPSGDSAIKAQRVVVATPSFDAAQLVLGIDGEVAAALEAIPYAPMVVAPLGVEPAQVRTPIDGFGFLVPRTEDLGLLGCLYMSQLFPGRAPAGHELLHCMLGGVRWPEAVELPDDTLAETLARDLETTLGLRDMPEPLAWVRWPRAVPQPDRHHAERMRWIASRLEASPGLALAGNYVAGVGVADALASGVAAAERVLASVAID